MVTGRNRKACPSLQCPTATALLPEDGPLAGSSRGPTLALPTSALSFSQPILLQNLPHLCSASPPTSPGGPFLSSEPGQMLFPPEPSPLPLWASHPLPYAQEPCHLLLHCPRGLLAQG